MAGHSPGQDCQARPGSDMRLHDMPAQTPGEVDIRKKVHIRAILEGKTMRQAVFEALELWLKEGERHGPKKTDGC
ncbi:hypothetical protein ES708_11542 [subsurface metagenome]